VLHSVQTVWIFCSLLLWQNFPSSSYKGQVTLPHDKAETFWRCFFCASWPHNSFITPTNAHLIRKNIILYCSYIFSHHLHHLLGAVHQNFKLYVNINYNRLQCNWCYVAVFMQLVSTYRFLCIRIDQQYALIVPLVYSTYWFLHVLTVACRHQGAY
jgi:hypothetical protein